jgi:hypothetical protein
MCVKVHRNWGEKTHFTLKLEVAWSFEMLVSYHITVWRHNPENYDLNLHRRESLKPSITSTECQKNNSTMQSPSWESASQ